MHTNIRYPPPAHTHSINICTSQLVLYLSEATGDPEHHVRLIIVHGGHRASSGSSLGLLSPELKLGSSSALGAVVLELPKRHLIKEKSGGVNIS